MASIAGSPGHPSMVYITGLPRTGTTLLQNLLAQDPHAHHLRLCDGLYPFPPPDTASWNDETDFRIVRTQRHIQAIYKTVPEMARIHSLDAQGPAECQWLFAHLFMDTHFVLRMHIPGYYAWLLDQNHEASYAEFHNMLKILGKHFTFDHWVLKAPRHVLFLDALLHEFPDAGIVWTHRDPWKVIPSLCSLLYNTQKGYSDHIVPEEMWKYHYGFTRGALERGMAARKHSNADRFLDIYYQDLITDPIREVKKIYAYFHFDYSSELERRMLDWLANRPKNKHGRHQYSVQQFGLTREEIDQDVADYVEAYSIPREE